MKNSYANWLLDGEVGVCAEHPLEQDLVSRCRSSLPWQDGEVSLKTGHETGLESYLAETWLKALARWFDPSRHRKLPVCETTDIATVTVTLTPSSVKLAKGTGEN